MEVTTGEIRATVKLTNAVDNALATMGQLAADRVRSLQVEEALVLGDEVLVGQTVREKLDLWADCAGQRLIPNPAHPNQPVLNVR